jgi:dsDNA-specific endonuclease/ATPase MutS2
MIFDFLLKRIRRARQEVVSGHPSIEVDDDIESLNPASPFPEPIVIEFRDVIDLHSIPPQQVRAVVEDYIEEAQRRGVRWVRIIHGKGIGVQREMVRSVLARARNVVDFRDAPLEAGGWGATVVTLSVDDAERPSNESVD